ncbi:hypothetical protein DACRYDRAFT_23905 [Dacryopinax primogenitus]|uniref:Uncharacterized protein n=1 Tax=Dacryopinax primogenitus (strain DJM 731) TaxID=1858805 RepID=M5FTF0_DACPD|nr:uncharacterized protein DACRYDRAFT_23905 [Dacryopinax primogenitus]EJT99338.1 hypothetical protein DACRYDRAFT_23905 [Dacryopinax primogenitus]
MSNTRKLSGPIALSYSRYVHLPSRSSVAEEDTGTLRSEQGASKKHRGRTPSRHSRSAFSVGITRSLPRQIGKQGLPQDQFSSRFLLARLFE